MAFVCCASEHEGDLLTGGSAVEPSHRPNPERVERGRRGACRPGGVRLVAALGVLGGLLAASSAAGQEALLERQRMTGDWNGVRPLLSAHGFDPI
jgi:hypothetical protein